MPAFKRDSASRLRDAERCMKGGEPLTTAAGTIVGALGISGAKHAEDVVCSQAAAAAFTAAT